MRDTRAAEARQGRHVGPVPVGFSRVGGVLLPSDAIGTSQLAFQLYATRQYSFVTVADALNTAGWQTPSGGLFTKFQVEEMLKNPVYIGRVRCNNQEYPGQHAAVIEQSLWDTMQDEIARRGKVADHSHRVASQPAVLTGLARCSDCGAPMWRSRTNGAYYHCSGRLTHAHEPRCNMRGVQAVAAEAHILLSLVVMSSDRDVLAQAADDLSRLVCTESKVPPIRDSKKIEEQIRRLGRLYEAQLKTDIEFETELAALHTQLAATQATGSERVPDIHQATKVLNDVPKLIAQATDQERRALLIEVFDDIYLTPHQAMAVRPAAAYADILNMSHPEFNLRVASDDR